MHIVTLRTVIALLQGMLLTVLYFANQAPAVWPATNPFLFVPLTVVTIYVPLLIMQSLGTLRFKTLMTWGISAAIILSGLAYYAVFRQLPAAQSLSIFPFFSTFIFLFIAHSLVLSSDLDKHFIAHYPTYFDMAWKLAVQTAFSVSFVVAFWILLWLGAALFNIIDLSFFEKFITKPWFAIPATTLITSIALHITDVKANIINGIRTLILVLLSWLLPLITAIVCLFLLSLPFTGITTLLQQSYGLFLLIATALHLIILINAAYQDGQNTLLAIQRYAMYIASCLLTPITILAIYALYARINQEGWLIENIYATACLSAITFYAATYLLSAFKQQATNKWIQTGNIVTAYLILFIILALLTPIADPARLMVRDQLSRLKTGKISADKFDYKALRFDGARYGHEALINLQTSWKGAQAEKIRVLAHDALKMQSRYSYRKTPPTLTESAKKKLLIIHTQDGKLPKDFLEQDWSLSVTSDSPRLPNCLTLGENTCHAWIIESNSPIVLLLDSNIFFGFQKSSQNKWQNIGQWVVPYHCKTKTQVAAEGKFKTATPIIPDIEIEGLRIPFEPNKFAWPTDCK